ncbi:MAG TPA: serine/threonine-protein kinase [Gemmatimonadales bacterium]|nr:serine/threonine-protein kinase [Gemmatimonadales bacterium]
MFDVLDSLRESLAPRYDVERQIGAGGMAQVFLAVEQHPHRRVAIKVLDPELSTRLLRERFIREVDLSSKLSHPHIMPIFAAGEAGGLFYYVMPYLEGESLRHRLGRERALPLDDALHITRDVADALHFAHAQGIIHRDIKPENILLSGDHAIVADFGIARAISAAGALSLTQTGQAIGSPGYMSPEQALGMTELDARTDIYSLGCVLFEMLAGEPPVPSLTERLVQNWQALDSRPTLQRAGPRVARAVKHAISRALAPVPQERFPTAGEFAVALGGAGHRASVPMRGFFASRRGRRVAFAGAVVALLGVVAAARFLQSGTPHLNERRVVVAVIENRTGDPALDNLGHMAADWVTQGLAQTGLVEVVPSMSAMTSSAAAGGEGPGHLDAAAIRALGQETGAGTVVSGAYYRQADSVRFQVQISAARDGKLLRALDPVAGPLAQPLSAVETVRQRVMAALATLFDSRLSRWAMTASQPPNFQAYQEFIAGLDRFVQFDMRGAIAHFERASAVDTTFRLPLIFAANAYMNLGEFAAADSIGHALQRHAGRLAPLDRFYLAWVLATCRGDGAEALRAARAMANLAPASETLYLVAENAMWLIRPREAVEALVALGPDRGFTRGWWVYWYDLTTALHLLGDHRRELKQALEGARRFPDSPQILTTQIRALAALGRAEEVTLRLGASVNLPPEQGLTPADVMLLAAVELRAHGHPAAADTALAQARDWLAARPPAEAASEAHRYRVALVSYTAGRLADAQREFGRLAARESPGRSDSLAVVAVMGDGWDQMDYPGYLGAIAARQGNREQALRVDRTMAGVKRPYVFGRHTVWRARIQALLGEQEAAVALLREAFAQGYPHGHTLHIDLAFDSLRDYAPFRELMRPKE